MSDPLTITLRGRVGTDIRYFETENGSSTVRFRLAVPQWRLKDNGEFEERDTKWYTIRGWDHLAKNVNASIFKGQPIIVSGRPSVNAWKNEEGEIRSEMVITAYTIGHDLGYGWSVFSKATSERNRNKHTDSDLQFHAHTADSVPGSEDNILLARI